ncbi:aminopeptidase P family protein [Methanobrevibacter sp.]|uniref:aminopeptidase P family protein n=1 Tax=Methanobrevibacter sp. TaxID=66852 RepID=UPI0025FAB66F|nr:aminopeptidase P family protein [Methanobrevibacter sp.]MBQ2962021.1 aminopeptidase P family protein [Methanobrevibacter sp.]
MQIKENDIHRFHINNILKKLEEKDQDAMLVANFNNIHYLSGYLSTSFAFLIIKEYPIIFVSGMDMEIARDTSSIDIVKYESFDVMIKYLKEEGIKNLAIESDLTANVYQKFNDFNLSISDAISTERMIKSDDEVERILKATDIAHKSLIELDVRSKQEKGAEEWECAYELGYLMRKNGASIESFDTIFASGSVSSLPHSTPRQHILETPVLVDYGCKFEGYCSDTTRTFLYTERQEEISDIVLEAHDKAIDAVKAGVKACEVDKVARDIITEYGYGDNFIHSTGHSLGLDIHENPSVSLKDQTVLENNMIITIEPGIYLEGEFGIRIEDMVLVDKKGKLIGDLPQIL